MSAPPALRKAACIQGDRLVLRDAGEADAAFIHGLRTDPVRARYLSVVPPDIEAQRAWLRGYEQDNTQAYFIVADAVSSESLGTVRLYGARGLAFSWGSWLLKAGLPARCAVESALIVYHYGRLLGFESVYFEVRRENASVWRFHESCGARRVGQRDDHFLYTLTPDALAAALCRYRRYLPHGIRVTP
ncbi:GNAT family N-acetyltransferase [Ottowia sp.]|uniref:GNAT family N-acetyltransferase n=1 Tax=Ottowia sp. TaxID=1898956 RepID=UPI00262B08CE|nr:GNAT family N-acetyltransferase [Ottowia sp.]